MKTLSILTVFLMVGLLICAGCKDRLNRTFDYNDVIANCGSGQLRVRLLGTYTSSKTETTRGSPYEIFVSFRSKTDIEGQVIIRKLDLYSVENQKSVYSLTEPRTQNLVLDSDGAYVAYFSLDKVELDFLKYSANIELEIVTSGKATPEDFKVEFDKNYEEHRTNTFWEKLMGV